MLKIRAQRCSQNYARKYFKSTHAILLRSSCYFVFFFTPMFPCEHGVYRETVWMPRDCSLLLVLLLFILLFSDAPFERMKRAFTLSYFIIKRKHIWVPLRKVIYKINTALIWSNNFFLSLSVLSHKLFNLHFLSLTAYYNCIDQPTPRTECLFLVE